MSRRAKNPNTSVAKASFATLVLALSLALGAGCGPKEEDEETPEKPKVAFEGTSEPKLVATWKTTDGQTTYTLSEDGAYVLKGKASTPKGPVEYTNNGFWKAANDRVLFKDKDDNVVPYLYELSGKKLTLTMTGSMKNKTVLHKQ